MMQYNRTALASAIAFKRDEMAVFLLQKGARPENAAQTLVGPWVDLLLGTLKPCDT